MDASGLHVEHHGEGPRAVVLAHGFGGSARNWRPQVRVLRDRRRIVTYDARGHARSTAEAEAGAFTLEGAVADLDTVVTGCGDARPVVGGLSMGAATALAWAAAYPNDLSGLVLAAFPGGPDSGRGVSAHAQDFAAAIDAEGLEAAGERFAWGPSSGLDAQGRALVRQGFLEHDPAALAAVLRDFLAKLPPAHQWAERLARVDVPVLAIAGDRDRAALDVNEVLASGNTGVRVVTVPDAGHVVNLAQPVAFNAALEDFMSEVAAG